jgi:hypothetical protein
MANDLPRSLPALFRELTHGAGPAGFMLNPGDAGLLASLDRLTAVDASASSPGGASIAAHVDHLRYGLSLMNRWAAGEQPFTDANWATSWEKGEVSDHEWAELRRAFREQAESWLVALQQPRDLVGMELDGVIGSIAHLAYHLGAIRQISALTRGPRETKN